MTEDEVATQLYLNIEEVDAIPEYCELDEWQTATIPERFGWSWPVLTDDGFVVEFCPAVIHKTMHVLDADDRQHYLNAVIASIHLHIVHYEDYDDLSDRTLAVDAAIHDKASGSVNLLSKVQLAALDST
jgi:hypothetical protein